jgi:hypothetical protein
MQNSFMESHFCNIEMQGILVDMQVQFCRCPACSINRSDYQLTDSSSCSNESVLTIAVMLLIDDDETMSSVEKHRNFTSLEAHQFDDLKPKFDFYYLTFCIQNMIEAKDRSTAKE